MKNICVYAASSDALDPAFYAAAEELGRLLAQRGNTLVYGGGAIGLMGALAKGVHAGGGHVVGVIPRGLRAREIAYEAADELVLTDTMRERKAIMENRGDAFVVLPGGFGTLEEAFEIIVLKQLKFINKPLIFLNIGGVFDDLFHLFERLIAQGFVGESGKKLYNVAETPETVFHFLDATHAE